MSCSSHRHDTHATLLFSEVHTLCHTFEVVVFVLVLYDISMCQELQCLLELVISYDVRSTAVLCTVVPGTSYSEYDMIRVWYYLRKYLYYNYYNYSTSYVHMIRVFCCCNWESRLGGLENPKSPRLHHHPLLQPVPAPVIINGSLKLCLPMI